MIVYWENVNLVDNLGDMPGFLTTGLVFSCVDEHVTINSASSFLFNIYIYMFSLSFKMAGSLNLIFVFIHFFLAVPSLRCGTQAFSSCGMGVACCSACALKYSGSPIAVCGLVAPQHVGSYSSIARDRILVACIGRQILNQWTSREVPVFIL